MKRTLLHIPILLALLSPQLSANEEVTHISLARQIIELLSQTELVLNTCQNEASVKEAIPQLKELAEQAQQLKQQQSQLPDSSLNEDLTIAKQVPDFLTIWDAIRAHIERLENSKLLSDELREVLKIAPTTNKE